jgi:hypothetical protein
MVSHGSAAAGAAAGRRPSAAGRCVASAAALHGLLLGTLLWIIRISLALGLWDTSGFRCAAAVLDPGVCFHC